jgi:L-amino acid N-acyltransferase YncA
LETLDRVKGIVVAILLCLRTFKQDGSWWSILSASKSDTTPKQKTEAREDFLGNATSFSMNDTFGLFLETTTIPRCQILL